MMICIRQLLFHSALMFSLAAILIGQSALANESGLVLPAQAHSNIEFTVPHEWSDLDPAETLQVFVGQQDTCCAGKSPIAGRYSMTGSTVTFDPAFDFVEGQHYTIMTRNSDAGDNLSHGLKAFIIQPADEISKPEVVMVYPSSPTLPENTLRFYIHFSTPMKPHLAEEFIQLIDADGKPDTTAFMTFKQELWSTDRKRLTLLLDPGRIKRGVAQNLEMGPALLEGNTYSIVVKAGWPGASGKQKAPGFKKTFSVTPALRTLPDTALWKVDSPKISTLDPLTIKFDRPFDHQLAQTSIMLLDKDGQLIPGTVAVEENETSWRFQPEKAWGATSVQIATDARLEDVAGNNFKDLLDHSVATALKRVDQTIFTIKLKPAH